MDLTRPCPTRIPAADVLVYLADDTVVPLAVENLSSISAHELHRAVREVLQLTDVALEAFALWLVSPLLGKVWQQDKHPGEVRTPQPVAASCQGGWDLVCPRVSGRRCRDPLPLPFSCADLMLLEP